MPKDYDEFNELDNLDDEFGVLDNPELRPVQGRSSYRTINTRTGEQMYGSAPADSLDATAFRRICAEKLMPASEREWRPLPPWAKNGAIVAQHDRTCSLPKRLEQGTLQASRHPRQPQEHRQLRQSERDRDHYRVTKEEQNGMVKHRRKSIDLDMSASAPKDSNDARVHDKYARELEEVCACAIPDDWMCVLTDR